MCCCASRRVFIASPCRPCASPNSSANACFCEGRSQKSTNRHPATPASLNSNTPPTNWNFDMLDFPRTALRFRGDERRLVQWRCKPKFIPLWRQMERLCEQTFEHLRGRQLAPEHAIVLLRHAEQGVDGVHHRADGQIILDVEGGRHVGTRGECREIERQ